MSSGISYYKELHEVLSRDRILSSILRRSVDLNLPQWWLAGGVIRDIFWGNISKIDFLEKIRDIDIIYFDSNLISKEFEDSLSEKLTEEFGIKWSIRNQARMHIRNDDRPYRDVADSIARFPETISTIIVRIDLTGCLYIANNYGYDDLFDMILRPTPYFQKKWGHKAFIERVNEKKWLSKWPGSKISEW